MPMISWETEKRQTVKDSGFKVGDILWGQTHMYRTVTYWYEIVKTTTKQLTLRRLNVSYPTAYCSNTPGSQCYPVLEVRENDPEYIIDKRFPYHGNLIDWGIFKASISRMRSVEIPYDTREPEVYGEWKYIADIIGDHYTPSLSLWDGETPGWVNCD